MKTLVAAALLVLSTAAFAQTTKSGNFHIDQDYKIAPSGTLTIRCSDAKVYVTGSDRASAHVKIDYEVETKGMTFGTQEFGVDIDDSNGNLTLRERKHGNIGIVGYMNEKYVIEIQVPKGVNLVIAGDDGNFEITTINGYIDIDLDDANIVLTGCEGSDFRFRLDDGDVKMDQGKGTFSVDADDSDIEVRNAKFSKISAEVDDGDFIVETSLVDNGDYYIRTQDGRVSMTVTAGGGRFDIRHDDTSVRANASFSVVEESEDRSRYTLSNGNAKVDIRADDGSIRLSTK